MGQGNSKQIRTSRRGFPRDTPSLFSTTSGSVTSYRLWKYPTVTALNGVVCHETANRCRWNLAYCMGAGAPSASWKPCERKPPLKADRQVPVITFPSHLPFQTLIQCGAVSSKEHSSNVFCVAASLQPLTYDEPVVYPHSPFNPPPPYWQHFGVYFFPEQRAPLVAK